MSHDRPPPTGAHRTLRARARAQVRVVPQPLPPADSADPRGPRRSRPTTAPTGTADGAPREPAERAGLPAPHGPPPARPAPAAGATGPGAGTVDGDGAATAGVAPSGTDGTRPLDGPVRAGAAPRPAPGASGPTVEPLGRTALATYSHAVPPPPSRRPLLPALPPGTGAGASGSLDSRHACCMVALAAVEVLAGVRPLAQLARWLTPDVYDGLARRAALTVPRGSALGMPGGRRATVRRVRVCPVDEQVVEASVVVAHAGRVRGVAVRLTRASGRWRAAALVVG